MALSKKYRVKSRKDFNKIFRARQKLKGSFLFLKLIKTSNNNYRVGFVIPSRLYKKATDRNTIKRKLSEVFRNSHKPTNTGRDVMIVVTSPKLLDNQQKAAEELKQMLNEINLQK